MVTAGAVAVLAATSLTACRTNVGYAATIDGTRYSESDISDYLTPDAAPVARQDSAGAQVEAPVRSFVLETIISEKLLAKVASQLPGGTPSDAVMAQLRATVLQGSSLTKAVRAAGIRGYTMSFNNILVRRVVFSQYLQAASQQGINVDAVLQKVPFRVSVSPRYGEWDAKNRTFDGAAGAGAPAFLTLQSPPKTPPAASSTGR